MRTSIWTPNSAIAIRTRPFSSAPAEPTEEPPAQPPAGGGGFFDEPWVDDTLAGSERREAFRDGFELGAVDDDFGGLWTLVESESGTSTRKITAVTSVKRTDTYGCELKAIDFSGATWTSTDVPKMAVFRRSASTTGANWPVGIGTEMYQSFWLLLPSSFPNVGQGTPMGDATPLWQIKADSASNNFICSLHIGRNSGDPADALRLGIFRVSVCGGVEPENWPFGKYMFAGANALLTRNAWHNITVWMRVGTKTSSPKGQLRVYLNGNRVLDSFTETGTDGCFDNATDKTCTTTVVNNSGWGHYMYFGPTPGSATQPGPVSAYYDDVQIFGVVP